jgi:MFS family permease
MAKTRGGYHAEFWRMCAGALLFFLSFNMVLPELPDALRRLGGGQYLGWIIPAFAFSALIARPFSGWLTDTVGRKAAMAGGCLFCIAAGLLYPLAGSMFAFFLIRALHGFSAGFSPTGFTAYTSDVVPEEKMGEAMGWQGIFNNLGTAMGFSLGAFIALKFGSNNLFYCSSVFAIMALVLFYGLPETAVKQKNNGIFPLFYTGAWQPAFCMLMVCIPLGAILTVMPDYTLFQGYSNKGVFLSVYVFSSLLVRIFSGKLSDKMGREISVGIGTFMQMISLILLSNHTLFWISAVLYGVGQGFNAPGLFAWTSDLSSREFRGRAIAFLFMALEAGIILGGLGSGYLLETIDKTHFTMVFGLSAIFPAITLSAVMLMKYRRNK